MRALRRLLVRAVAVAAAATAAAHAVGAQQPPQQTRAQREELNRVRQERAALERRMRDLQGTAHDLSEETGDDALAAALARDKKRGGDTITYIALHDIARPCLVRLTPAEILAAARP